MIARAPSAAAAGVKTLLGNMEPLICDAECAAITMFHALQSPHQRTDDDENALVWLASEGMARAKDVRKAWNTLHDAMSRNVPRQRQPTANGRQLDAWRMWCASLADGSPASVASLIHAALYYDAVGDGAADLTDCGPQELQALLLGVFDRLPNDMQTVLRPLAYPDPENTRVQHALAAVKRNAAVALARP